MSQLDLAHPRRPRETVAEAAARHACLDCGKSDAALYSTADGRNIRVCARCASGWWKFGLTEREPLPIEAGQQ